MALQCGFFTSQFKSNRVKCIFENFKTFVYRIHIVLVKISDELLFRKIGPVYSRELKILFPVNAKTFEV